ncbi:GGDEF domain-containing protein [Alteromonas antoniana]|uniref:GGDEF domain-containing protein n=1 Tax=Alteromonas antoniana TaxID=2803813 RepID=UPI001C446AFC|nr:GGDEF domain-containing protein [Alteromonas antoniana]
MSSEQVIQTKMNSSVQVAITPQSCLAIKAGDLASTHIIQVAKDYRTLRKASGWAITFSQNENKSACETLLTISVGEAVGAGRNIVISSMSLAEGLHVRLEVNNDAQDTEDFLKQHSASFVESVVSDLSAELAILQSAYQIAQYDKRYLVSQMMLKLSSHIFEEGVIDRFLSELVEELNVFMSNPITSMSVIKWDLKDNTFEMPAVLEEGKMSLGYDKFPISVLNGRPISRVIETGLPLLMTKSESHEALKKVNIHRSESAATYILPMDLGEHSGALSISSNCSEAFNGLDLACLQSAGEALSTIYRQNMLQSKTYQQANFDAVTGLANRAHFNRFLGNLNLDDEKYAGVLYIDLDKFKEVNDLYGHDVGDLYLKAVSGRIAGQLRDHDLPARIGGDEFAVVLDELQLPTDAERVAARILRSLELPLEIDGVEHNAGVSIGVCVFDNVVDVSLALKRADKAMYEAKTAGRGQFKVYSEGK